MNRSLLVKSFVILKQHYINYWHVQQGGPRWIFPVFPCLVIKANRFYYKVRFAKDNTIILLAYYQQTICKFNLEFYWVCYYFSFCDTVGGVRSSAIRTIRCFQQPDWAQKKFLSRATLSILSSIPQRAGMEYA